ncbi:MAG: T9SS type A sorting domain-containing protein [Bacteroidia bacterium]
MKRIKLLLYLLLASSWAQAQTESKIWSDTFEDTGAPSSGIRNPENNSGSVRKPFKSYFVRTTSADISVTNAYTGFQGAKFWAGEDHLGMFGIGKEEQQIDFEKIDITGKTGLTFKGLFAANSTSKAWENKHYKNSPSTTTDYIYVEYRIDNGNYKTLIKFFGDNDINKNLSEDTGIDSIGDGITLTSAFKEFSKEIALTGKTLDIRIKVSSNKINKEWAIDNFRLFETLPCNLAVTAANVINVTCKGGADGQAAVSVTGANGAVTYDWTPGNPSGNGTASVKLLKAGTYTCTVNNGPNCSKKVEITVEPANAISFTQTLTFCAGKSVKVGTKTYTNSGNYTDVIKSWKGCDSTVITNLTVSPALTKAQEFTLCAGKSVTVGTHTYNTTGTFTDKLKTAGGCDSIVTTKVIMLKPISITQTLNVCMGKSVKVGTHTYSVSGTYTDVLIAKNNCDSTVITKLTVSPILKTNQARTICMGGSFQVANHVYKIAGVYKDTLKTKGGCDSLLITTLTVTPAFKFSQRIVLCGGDSLVIGKHIYKVSGQYSDTVKTKAGCDSIVTTQLTISPILIVSQQLTICAGKSIVIGKHTYTVSGTYKDTVKTKRGCDSTINTQLTVLPILSTLQKLTICEGKSVKVGTKTYTVSGNYIDVIKSWKGCDSTVTTNLTVSPALTKAQEFTLCAGKSVIVGTHTYNTAGTYTDKLKTAGGCDSIVTTKVTMLKPISTTQALNVCMGKSIKVGAHTYSVSGTYTDVLIAKNNCDSTVITKLTVSPILKTNQAHTICMGGSLQVANHVYTKAGVYKDTLKTNGGCDSLLTTMLTVTPALRSFQRITICAGKSIVVGKHVHTTSGIYADTAKTKGGCDSIITTQLTVSPILTGSQQYTICAGKSIVVGTHNYTVSGKYVDTVKTKGGCDSAITTQLTVSPILSGSQQFTICEGQSVVVGKHTYTVSGTYNDTLHNGKNCDSLIVTQLNIIPALKVAQKARICDGEVFVVGKHSYSKDGIYTDTLKTQKGCDSILTTNLVVIPLPHVTIDIHTIDTLCISGGTVQLSGGLPLGGTYSGDGVSNTIFNPITAGLGKHVVTYSYTDSLNGCKSIAKATIFVDVCLSIKNNAVLSVLDAYPNPFTESFTISLVVAKPGMFTITLTNVLGETMKEIEKSFLTGTYKNEINAKELEGGIYFITVQSAEGKIVRRIIKN